MADKKEKKDDEEEVVAIEVDERGRQVEEEPEEKEDDKEEKEDKGDKEDEKDDDEDDEEEKLRATDERAGHEDSDETERRRERRRAERAEGKRVRREARDRNIRELDFLRRRNEQLERRFSEVEVRTGQSELLAIDNRVAQIKGQIKDAEEVMADAVKNAAGDDLVEATRIKDQLQDGLEKLTTYRARIEQQGKTRQPDPQLVARAELFRAENPWWVPQSNDPDSRVVSAIDTQLGAEGTLDPRTPEYWDELTKRIKKKLPHRFKAQAKADEGDDDDDDEPVRRNGHAHDDDDDEDERGSERHHRKGGSGGPRFSSRGRERPLRKNEVYVSPERKAALVEMGVWDDPVLRSRYLKQYQKYDRENKDQRH